jgi:hypothetical protein
MATDLKYLDRDGLTYYSKKIKEIFQEKLPTTGDGTKALTDNGEYQYFVYSGNPDEEFEDVEGGVNNILIKGQQTLTEEEQDQVKSNLGIEDAESITISKINEIFNLYS